MEVHIVSECFAVVTKQSHGCDPGALSSFQYINETVAFRIGWNSKAFHGTGEGKLVGIAYPFIQFNGMNAAVYHNVSPFSVSQK